MTTLRRLDRSPTTAPQRLALTATSLVLMISGCISHQSSVPEATVSRRLISAEKSEMVKPIRAGAHTDGGLSGSIVRVTTLEADGAGSLRRALEMNEPRLIVFEVGGVIDLKGRSLVVRAAHLTVAGQTAPDPGITIIRGSFTV